MKNYSIMQICEDVADSMPGCETDIPAIRTAINDRIDQVTKDGHVVRDNWSQTKAVRRVAAV